MLAFFQPMIPTNIPIPALCTIPKESLLYPRPKLIFKQSPNPNTQCKLRDHDTQTYADVILQRTQPNKNQDRANNTTRKPQDNNSLTKQKMFLDPSRHTIINLDEAGSSGSKIPATFDGSTTNMKVKDRIVDEENQDEDPP